MGKLNVDGTELHNSRKFHAKNTDPERSCLNVEYCNENIKDVYHELFDEALARYNEKQTRNDRIIDNYYEKICSGKQEKPFHEIILQIGNKDDMGAKTEDGRLAEIMLQHGIEWDKKALPLVEKLKEVIKNLTIKCVQLTEQGRKQSDTIDWLQERASDLERLERHLGREQVQPIVDGQRN